MAKATFRHPFFSHISPLHSLHTPNLEQTSTPTSIMGKRHNRKRTRSRPRHRDGSNLQSTNHTRSLSVDTISSCSTTTNSSFQPSIYPTANLPSEHWHQTYFAWQNRRLQEEQERDREVEMQRLRIFGGEPGDEVSLLEPMMKVVTDLFDGFTDYEDP